MHSMQNKRIISIASGLATTPRIAKRAACGNIYKAALFRTISQQSNLAAPACLVSPPYQIQRRRNFSNTGPAKMASDEDYMAFLNKANQDLDDARAAAATTQSSGPPQFKTTDVGSEVPKVIQDAIGGVLYTSEADEPFHGVALQWTGDGGLPDEEEFAKLIHHWDTENAEIEIMDPFDWDSQGQYTNIIEAVREATQGNDVRVYKVIRDASRAEYWVISRDDVEGRVVGVKALGIES